jgi:hypothetical protein
MSAQAAKRIAGRLMMSPKMQELFKSTAKTSIGNPVSFRPNLSGLATVSGQQPPAYKRGGRVADHLTAADQLVRAAERAKKGQSAQTEALLQQPDSVVAHALEVANRSI